MTHRRRRFRIAGHSLLLTSMQNTLAIARLWYEANSFTPLLTGLAQFRQREWVAGDEAIALYRGTRTELGAAVAFLQRHPHWHGHFLRCAAASPGGPVIERDLQEIFREILEGIATGSADAVYLSLHGALIGEHTLCADLELIRSVRKAIGSRPLAVTFDLHANVAAELARHVDILVGYKTYPHIDMYEAAERALGLLDAMVAGKVRPRVAIRKAGAILPSFRMRTESGPMADIQSLARACEQRDAKLLDVSPFGGFAYADTPCAGASAVVTTDGDDQLAESTAADMAAQLQQRAHQFIVHPLGASAAIDQALAQLPAHTAGPPVAIVEPSDNPLSGGAGGCPGLLRAIVERNLPLRIVFAFFWDPELVARCHADGVGAKLTVALGARLTKLWGDSVSLDITVEKLTEGRYRNAGPMERGLAVDLGRTAVVRADNLRVIITESCQAPNDPEYFSLHGV